jgi:hypothetical protein
MIHSGDLIVHLQLNAHEPEQVVLSLAINPSDNFHIQKIFKP